MPLPSPLSPPERTLAVLEFGVSSGLHLGGQMYVSSHGARWVDFAFGRSRPNEEMTREHLMLWLSTGKPITAVAIAQLWEQGIVALDDPVVEHVPEFGAHGKDRITLRHLLTHTAGIRMLDTGWPRLSWDEIIARISASRPEPHWIPGHKAGYHRASSWFVLAEIVHRRSGLTFPRYVRERIFRPLGMDDCWIGMPEERYENYGARLAPMFNTETHPPTPHPWTSPRRLESCFPGGNACGPIRQLGRFYEALNNGGTLGGTSILTPQTVEAMVARHRVGLVDKTFRRQMDWGLGVIPNSAYLGGPMIPYQYGPHASMRAYGHSGYRSSTAFADPEADLVVALAFNGTPSEESHEQRIDAVLSALYEDFGLASSSSP